MKQAEVPDRAARAIEQWAAWTRGSIGGGCVSPAWLMMQANMVGITVAGTAPLPEMSEDACLVDQVVCRLPAKLAKPFKVYYLQYAPAEEKAVRCGLRGRLRTFYRRVERARLRVADDFMRSLRRPALQPVTVFDTKRSHCGSLSLAVSQCG